MKVHVVGVGAIGSLVAFNLKRSTSHPVVLHYRRPQPESAHTIRFAPADGDDISTESGFLIEHPEAQADASGPEDAVIITTKVQNVQDALKALASAGRLSSASTVLLVCNGLPSVLPALQDAFAASEGPTIVVGHTAHGVYKRADGCWVHAGRGRIICAAVPSASSPPPSFDVLKSALEACAPLAVTFVDYPEWREGALVKLAANCTANAATALLNSTNGALLLPVARPYVEAILGEVAAAYAAGKEAGALSHADLMRTTTAIFEVTIANFSSTLADIERIPLGAGDNADSYTELAHINGYISRLGKQYGVPTPLNDALVVLAETKGHARALGICR